MPYIQYSTGLRSELVGPMNEFHDPLTQLFDVYGILLSCGLANSGKDGSGCQHISHRHKIAIICNSKKSFNGVISYSSFEVDLTAF